MRLTLATLLIVLIVVIAETDGYYTGKPGVVGRLCLCNKDHAKKLNVLLFLPDAPDERLGKPRRK